MSRNILKVKKTVIEEIVRDSVKCYPMEGCGYLGGDGKSITIFLPMRNVDESSEHFSMDPSEQFFAIRKLREKGLKVMAVYHSHPYTPARPSEEDIKLAYDPQISYLIVSLKDYRSEIKSFRIKNGVVEEEQILIEE